MAPSNRVPPDRANRIADAVEDIEQNVARLRDDQQLSRSEYTAAENYDLRNAVERKFEKLTEATLDIAEEICKQERGAAPNRRKEKITALEDEGISQRMSPSDYGRRLDSATRCLTRTARSSTTTSCTTLSRRASTDTWIS